MTPRHSANNPSAKRVDWRGWIGTSGALGLATGIGALAALWRPLPLLGAPPGELSEHAVFLAESAVHLLAPSLFRSAWATYASFLSQLAFEDKAALIARAGVACIAAVAPAAFLARSLLKARTGLFFERGPQRHEGREATRALRRRFAKQSRLRPDHDIAPSAPFPGDMWTRHVLVLGGTGGGKTTFIKPLLHAIANANERALVFDPKGEFTEELGRAAIIAPWDSRSLAWDIAADLTNTQHMRGFAAAIVAESSDPMWSNAARQLLCGLLIYLRQTKGSDWGWRDLAALVALSQPELLAIMRDHHPEAVRVVERASVTTQGVLINLASFCSPILDLAEAWGETPRERRIGFRRWTKGKSSRRQIVLQGHGAYEELTQRYVSAIVGLISATVNSVEMTDDTKRKLWIVADELPQMGKVPIRQLFAVGRSRGVRCVIACQDFAQLEEIHGEPMVRALASMCGTLVIGQISPGDTADRLCKTIGSREHERMNVSSSMSASGESSGISFSRETVPLYSPSELVSRLGPTPDGKGAKLLVFTGGDAHELFFPFLDVEKVRAAHVPAPWTLGLRKSGLAHPVDFDAAFAAIKDPSVAANSGKDIADSPTGTPCSEDEGGYVHEMQRLAGDGG
ncbi:type IV secretion system DNA-binding domain-containing protein [Caballeronia sordidicola]|uniref:IncF plasmid conjugative transfer protein TraD n=1 Tax=Caballeronia sordidicola TaxID=196367 RepID=A0A226WWV3_CABSO|nr:type IV secretion system DNA-binding domain-containing protein [Caballeronia sordidicola]OXC75671.1 IncF plasmid conjugative transfer protein TraD [Caballeronia sordidicola]